MVVQKIKDIDPKKLKNAQGAIALLELLGITEEDLLLIKEITSLRQELADMKQEYDDFKKSVIRTLEVRADSNKPKSVSEIVKQVYNTPTKEFNPHYGRED